MRLQQPDRRSCGAAALVMARRLVRPRYAGLVSDQATFAHEAATLHRRLTSLADMIDTRLPLEERAALIRDLRHALAAERPK